MAKLPFVSNLCLGATLSQGAAESRSVPRLIWFVVVPSPSLGGFAVWPVKVTLVGRDLRTAQICGADTRLVSRPGSAARERGGFGVADRGARAGAVAVSSPFLGFNTPGGGGGPLIDMQMGIHVHQPF